MSVQLHVLPPPLPVVPSGPTSIAAVKVLRISLTDRCNLRCVYCMPQEGMPWMPRENQLTNDEIATVVEAAAHIHGIGHIKLTGGEPTMRAQLPELIYKLRAIQEVKEISMTTNGVIFKRLAAPLKDAGLDRVTFSLDSLRPERFRAITRNGDVRAVLRAIAAAERSRLRNLKLNVVVMRGINDDEVADFAALTIDGDLTVRFIEYMPMGYAMSENTIGSSEIGPAGGCRSQDRGSGGFVAESEMRQRIEQFHGPLQPMDRSAESGLGPSVIYRLPRHKPRGRIGFISAMSKPFCDSCNRLRLTADGVLRSCLFDGGEVDVRVILRHSRFRSERKLAIARAMEECVRLKPQLHSARGNIAMSRIGG